MCGGSSRDREGEGAKNGSVRGRGGGVTLGIPNWDMELCMLTFRGEQVPSWPPRLNNRLVTTLAEQARKRDFVLIML